MLNKKKAAMGIIAIILIMLSYYAAALSPQTNRYIATKAFPTTPCQEKLLEGAIAPMISENWLANPDFKPQNWKCYNNDENCTAKQTAKKYLQTATTETDECKKAFNYGIYTTFYALSQTPSNWINTEPTCQTQFEQEIETKITNFETEWQIIKECPIFNEEGTIALNFSNNDLNRIINTIQQNAQTTQKDLNAPILIPIPEEEKGTLYDTIQQLIDQNKIVTTETINKKALEDLWDYSCFLSSTRKMELYEKWQQLDNIGKSCLTIFLSQKTATAYSLMLNCYQLNGGQTTQYNMQALTQAQWELTQYTATGFGETTCQKITTPIYMSEGQFTQGTQTTGMEYCETTSKNIPQGCIQEFQNDDKRLNETYSAGRANGMLILTIILVIIGIAFYLNWTKG